MENKSVYWEAHCIPPTWRKQYSQARQRGNLWYTRIDLRKAGHPIADRYHITLPNAVIVEVYPNRSNWIEWVRESLADLYTQPRKERE